MTLNRVVVSVLVLVAVAIPRANAQTPGDALLAPPSATPPTVTSHVDPPKSESTALALSLGTTLGGYAMFTIAGSTRNEATQGALALGGMLAVTVGPTTGHIYAGNTWNKGLQTRLAGVGLSVVGVLVMVGACPRLSDCDNDAAVGLGAAGVVGGVGLYMGGTIYEIATASRSARAYNASHAQSVQVGVAPLVARDHQGVSLVGRF